MNELSLHILDLVQNAISAGASHIIILVEQQPEQDLLIIEIRDDGCGMSEELLQRVVSPFATTRTTRKVGLGIPMFKQGAEQCEGKFSLASRPNEGTVIRAEFRRSHVDLPPMGDLAGTMCSLLIASPEKPEFTLEYVFGKERFVFDTAEIRNALGGLPLNLPEVIEWVKGYLQQGMTQAESPEADSQQNL